jgi:hypothetical protein
MQNASANVVANGCSKLKELCVDEKTEKDTQTYTAIRRAKNIRISDAEKILALVP